MYSTYTSSDLIAPAYAGWKLPNATRLLLRGSGTSDNLNQFTSNDGLASAVEENLELGDHVTGVLGGVLKLHSSAEALPFGYGLNLHPWRCDELTARRRGPRPEPKQH